MPMPTFLLIGAAKAGTTALYDFVAQHPDVHMSRWKEPKYFAFDGPEELTFRGPDGPAPINVSTVTDRTTYEDLFAGAPPGAARGEATAIYLYSETAARRIPAELPEARLVAILRNPIERAISSYKHLVRDGLEPLSFREALDAEPERIAQNYGYLWRYVDLGWYSRQLDRYASVADAGRLLVLFHDDLRRDPEGTCQSVFRFLDVDPSFGPDTSTEPNLSGQPRSRFIHRLLNPPTPVKRRVWDALPSGVREPLRRTQSRLTNRNLAAIEVPAADRAHLAEVFSAEVARLEQRFDRDLSHWLEPRAGVAS